MKNIAIFASGSGSNAKVIIEQFKLHKEIRVSVVVSNNSNAFVLEIAKNENIPTIVVSKEEYTNGLIMNNLLLPYSIDFIILAGYLKKIPIELIQCYPNKIINIHPSLLPKFGGKGMFGIHVHEAVIAANESITGITIHLVNEEYDKGKILFNTSIPVKTDDPFQLQKEVLKLEHEFYYKVILDQCCGEL